LRGWSKLGEQPVARQGDGCRQGDGGRMVRQPHRMVEL
jgi:hypothetical protein